MDVSHRALELAARTPPPRLTAPGAAAARLNLFQGSLTYRDGRLAG